MTKTKPRIALAAVAAIILVCAVATLGLRAYNHNKYGTISAGNSAGIADLASYDTDITGVDVDTIDGDYAYGFHFTPTQLRHAGSVITFGGSDGGPSFDRAAELARNGFEVYALFYFGAPGQQHTLKEVPLEFIEEVLPQAQRPVTVLGVSRGAELALNLAVRYPEIDNVVLFAPSAYSFQALDFSDGAVAGVVDRAPRPAWTWKGHAVPYVSLSGADRSDVAALTLDWVFGFPLSFVDSFSSAVANTAEGDRDAARIKVEDFTGNVLAFAGGDDRMWDSATAATGIVDRAQQRRIVPKDAAEAVVYPQAGHVLAGGRYVAGLDVGGNDGANEVARLDTNERLLKRLASWHRPHDSEAPA